MNRSIFALALAVAVMPLAALAQETNAPAPPASDQTGQAFEQFAQQERRLRDEMRSQMLASLSPVHLRAVAATIGDLAVAQTPDPQAAAQRLDQILSPGERQRILAAHAAFTEQSRQLHEQMMTQLQSEMPAAHADWVNHWPPNGAHMPDDAGTVLLMVLAPHPMLEMSGPMPMHPEGPPPQ
jgi:hypothetical protein